MYQSTFAFVGNGQSDPGKYSLKKIGGPLIGIGLVFVVGCSIGGGDDIGIGIAIAIAAVI